MGVASGSPASYAAYLSRRTDVATRVYAIKVPMDSMSTKASTSKMVAITATSNTYGYQYP